MAYNAQMVLLTATLLFTIQAVGATEFIVGGDKGWTVPTAANGLEYTAWANTNFVVGDSLVFKYNPSVHNVLSVSGAAFAVCNTSEPLGEWKDGNTKITFDKEGRWWFTCGAPNHCSAGQAFKVTVAGAPSHRSAAEAPATPPESGAGNTLIKSSKAVVIFVSFVLGGFLL